MNRRKFMQLCGLTVGGGVLGVGKAAGVQAAIDSFYKGAIKEGMAVPFGKHGWLTIPGLVDPAALTVRVSFQYTGHFEEIKQ